MKTLLSLVFASVLTVLSAQISIMPGMKMPEVSAEWLTSVREPELPPGKKPVEVVVFADLTRSDAVQVLRYLESLESKYAREAKGIPVTFRTVVCNDETVAKTFLKTAETPFTATVGCDVGGKTFRNFAIASVPSAFLGKDGAIVWSGPVTDVDDVAGAVLDGTFSASDYREISRLRTEMQTALRAGLPEVAAKTAEKILKIQPNDTVALQTCLYAFEWKGQNSRAAEFLSKQIADHPEKADARRLMLLDLLLRAGNVSGWTDAVRKAAENAESADAKLNLAAFLIDRSPMLRYPAETVLKLCAEVLSDEAAESDPEFRAGALEISARAFRSVCAIDRAVREQTEAVELRKKNSSPHLARAEETLAFYRKLMELSGKK